MKAITWKWLSTFFPTFLRPWLLTFCLGLEPHLLLSIKILVIRKTISMKQIPHVQEQEEVTWCQVRCVGWIGMAYTDSIEYWRWSYELQELVYCLEADECLWTAYWVFFTSCLPIMSDDFGRTWIWRHGHKEGNQWVYPVAVPKDGEYDLSHKRVPFWPS